MFLHRRFQNSDHGHGWKYRPSPTPCSSAPNFHCIGLPWTPPICFPGRLPHPSQGPVLGGVLFDNPNGIKNPYKIGIVPVAISVPLVPFLAVIVIFLLWNYCPRPQPFLSLLMGYMTCVHFVPEATERLVHQKRLCLENPCPSYNRRRAIIYKRLVFFCFLYL